jgi:hypothetical protein
MPPVERNPKSMRGKLISKAALLIAAGTVAVSVTPAAAAAATACSTRVICTFSGDNYNGTAFNMVPSVFNRHWYTFSFFNAAKPGSLIDNSGSDIWLFDRSQNVLLCVPAGERGAVDHGYGSFYIQYGIGDCSVPPPNPN